MAPTKNREAELVELHEQKKRIPSPTRTRIGDFIDAAYNRMEADTDDSAELTEQDV